MFFDTEGLPLQGITGGYGGDRRVELIIPSEHRSFPRKYYIEVTANGMFGVGQGTGLDMNRYFALDSADVVVPRMEAWHLLWVTCTTRHAEVSLTWVSQVGFSSDPRYARRAVPTRPSSQANVKPDITRNVSPSAPLCLKAQTVAMDIVATFRHDDLSTIARCRKIAERILGKGWQEHGAGVYCDRAEWDGKGGAEDAPVLAIGK